MIIDHVETYPLFYRLPNPYGDANGWKRYRACYMFRIVTKSGIEGWGECIDWLPALDKEFHGRIIPYLIGKSALQRNRLIEHMQRWNKRAAAGVSMALTEIAAHAAGMSVCDLWGGKRRDAVPLYASFQSYREDGDWQQQSVSDALSARERGFTKMKLKIGRKSLQEDAAHIERLQCELGGDVELALDANQSYDPAAALWWERIFCRWDNWLWLEEPLPLSDIRGYRRLKQRLNLPLAGGENLQTSPQFLPLLTEGALDIMQPDVVHVGGVDELQHAMHLARVFSRRTSPHAFDGVLSRLYAAFAQACVPAWSKMESQAEPLEWDVMENPFQHLLDIEVRQGKLSIPEGKGIGTRLDRQGLQTFRWTGERYD